MQVVHHRSVVIEVNVKHILSLKFFVDRFITTLHNVCAIYARIQRLSEICDTATQEQQRVLKIQHRALKDATEIQKATEEKLLVHARTGDNMVGAWILNTRDAQIGYEVSQRAVQSSEMELTDLKNKKNNFWWDLHELVVMRKLLEGTSCPSDLYTTRINTPLYHLLVKLHRQGGSCETFWNLVLY